MGLLQVLELRFEDTFFLHAKNWFWRGTIDKTLFIKKNKCDIIVSVYVDDIIFGSTMQSMCTEFEDCMHKRFQISSMGELTFFLGLQLKQKPNGIFISQGKYVANILKKFDFCSIKTTTTLIVSNKPLVKYEDGVDVDVLVYMSMIGSLMYLIASRPDIMFVVCACARFQVTPKASHLNAVKRIFSDYGGASLDRKSTTGGCQFLGRRLISWQCKKQTIMANSTTKVEYVIGANCCGQTFSPKLRAPYDAELVSAASLVNTARPTLSTARLAEGEGSGEPTEPQPTPSPTQPSTGDQPPETSSSHATTQDSRDSLEGTNGNEGDQVQTPHDSPLSGGHTSDRAEGALNLQELSVLCTNLSNRVLALDGSFRDYIDVLRAFLCYCNLAEGRKKSKLDSTLEDSIVFDDQMSDHEVVEDSKGSCDKDPSNIPPPSPLTHEKYTDGKGKEKEKEKGERGKNGKTGDRQRGKRGKTRQGPAGKGEEGNGMGGIGEENGRRNGNNLGRNKEESPTRRDRETQGKHPEKTDGTDSDTDTQEGEGGWEKEKTDREERGMDGRRRRGRGGGREMEEKEGEEIRKDRDG
ncbi:putative ribonuclease H-like domain-containing protein [Tanacetum coccineum]